MCLYNQLTLLSSGFINKVPILHASKGHSWILPTLGVSRANFEKNKALLLVRRARLLCVQLFPAVNQFARSEALHRAVGRWARADRVRAGSASPLTNQTHKRRGAQMMSGMKISTSNINAQLSLLLPSSPHRVPSPLKWPLFRFIYMVKDDVSWETRTDLFWGTVVKIKLLMTEHLGAGWISYFLSHYGPLKDCTEHWPLGKATFNQ